MYFSRNDCTSSDGSSNSYEGSYDAQTYKTHIKECTTSPDGNTCCETCVYNYSTYPNITSNCEYSDGCPEQNI